MLEIRDLHVKFHNSSREAVGGVSYTIEDGEIQGLVGESGSGKTVTAMSIAGLLPRKQCEYSGQILLDGMDLLHGAGIDNVNLDLMMLFIYMTQESYSLGKMYMQN